jgi:DNA-binding NarL/FixJ family response regulator
MGATPTAVKHAVAVLHASPVIRDGMVDLLGQQPDIHVVGVFPGAQAALDGGLRGDVILLYDQATSRQDGAALLADLRQRLPQAKILIFGVADDDQAIIECVRSGASGCMLLDAAVEDLVAAIRSVADGTPPVSPRVVTTLFSYVATLRAGGEHTPPSTLTAREEQILRLVTQGLSNQEIAKTLYLQPQTVKNYVHQVLQRLNLRSRFELIRSQRSNRQ